MKYERTFEQVNDIILRAVSRQILNTDDEAGFVRMALSNQLHLMLSRLQHCANISTMCQTQTNLATGTKFGNSLRTGGSDSQISPSCGEPGLLSNKMLLGTTQMSLPTGTSFHLTALAGCISVTDTHTYRWTDHAMVTGVQYMESLSAILPNNMDHIISTIFTLCWFPTQALSQYRPKLFLKKIPLGVLPLCQGLLICSPVWVSGPMCVIIVE